MKRALILFTCTLTVVLGIGCTRRPTDVAGGSTSTTNAKIVGTVSDETGGALPGSTVALRDIIITEHGDSAKTEWTTIADNTGNFYFDNIPQGNYVLMGSDSVSKNMGYVTHCLISGDTAVNLLLSKPLTLRGRISEYSTEDLRSMIISAAGTTNHVHPDADGYYTLRNIPKGLYDLSYVHGTIANDMPVTIFSPKQISADTDTVFIRDLVFTDSASAARYCGYAYTVKVSYGITPLVYQPGNEPPWYIGKNFSYVAYYNTSSLTLVPSKYIAPPTLWLDNFDDGDSLSMIFPLTGKSRWVVFNDSIDGGSSPIFPTGIEHAPSLGITDSTAFDGKSFRLDVRFNRAKIASPYASFGMNVTPKNSDRADFSGMTSFSFYCKGKGTIRVNFRTKYAENGYSGSDLWGEFGTIVQCPAIWTKIIIRPQDIVPPAGSKQLANGLKWQDGASSVTMVNFGTWETTLNEMEFFVDNIYVTGVADSVFLK